MKHGSGGNTSKTSSKHTTPSRPARRRRRPKRGKRARAYLFVLLILIGGLLAALIALLPDPADTEDIAGTQADSPLTPELSDADSTNDQQSETSGAATPESVDLDDPIVTETYPEEEVPFSAEPDAEDERWWLPNDVGASDPRGTLYLVLDDGGNNTDTLDQFLAFPGPLSIAVLPLLPYSVETAVRTSAAGKEVILHLPMESVGGANTGPGAILTGMTDREIIQTLDEDLKSIPGVVGVNNHMGSLATQDQRTMEIVLSELRRRELFFLDSRTTVDTLARDVAITLELPFAERQVFLDNKRTREEILMSLRHALELSFTRDSVVMIGHVTVPLLADVLVDVYQVLLDAGYRFGAISEIMTPAAPADGGR